MTVKPQQFVVVWHDGGQEPRNPPNPAYPNGIDLDLSQGRADCCTVELPYPARRIGQYRVTCKTCGLVVSCTTAGRLDDPRSLTLTCEMRDS